MINALREFEEEHPDQGLDAFLQDIALLTDADKKVENAKDRVTLMTMPYG
jgi:DNA helicase-2/ATP-dependent DNA helicase PcrA